ncbi:MAG: tetratricopeptide repeat protein [Bacteroidetes bacterium]|nr:tetratricopeptide repeat protein [Bacteroidota bacterium]MCL5737336.1 tetratricopeptide repeat protein [Bacteroidota bacterium]
MNLRKLSVLLGVIGLAFLLASCSSSQSIIVQGAGETFHRGMDLLRDEDYAKAKDEFDIVVKQYPASAYADSAQFYLAETYFKREEYLTAAFEFENVSRNYPSSKLAPEARFKIAQCYAAQSPRVELDQANTRKAIDAFQNFIDYYPNSALVPEAEKEIAKLRNKLAQKDYDIAQLYTTMGYYRAAIVYYDRILDVYHDSDVADKAAIGKVKALLKRHKSDEARAALEKFYTMFPDSKLKPEADELAHGLNLNVNKRDEVN